MRPSLAQFFELSIDMLCVADTTGYFRVVSPACTETLGWSPDELLAQPFVALVHPDDLAATEAEIDKLREGVATMRFENRYLAKDGGWVWLSWTCRPDTETGLLYAVARRFATLIGGTLSVTSTLGSGTTFVLTLANAPALANNGASDRGEIHTTVLVVDDDPDARRLLKLALERGGHRVVTAADADEGLALAHRIRPGAILLDLLMPGRDGWAALAALQADPLLARTPVIIVSTVDARNIGFALGVDGYVTKPVDRALLLSVVERALDRGARLGPILVVEDDPDARELLVRALVAQGHQVVEARDGREGLLQLERFGAALIVLDLIMPNLDGFELAETVRNDSRWNDVPIVVVSAADPSPAELARLDGEVLDVVRKDGSSTDALLRQVQRLLAGSAPTRPAVRRPHGGR